MKSRDQRTYEAFVRMSELPMLVLALLFIPVLLAPLLLSLSSTQRAAMEAASWLLWAAFAAEYVVKLYLAPDRRRMVRTHVFDLLLVVLPFLRPLRAMRALRLLQAGAAVGRSGVAIRRLLSRRGFSAFLLAAGGTVVSCGLLAWALERSHPDAQIRQPLEGVWWAIVTATTVGYGDLVPQTPEGRGVAVLLMLVGVALLSVVTANIAAFFVEESTGAASDAGATLEDIVRRLDRIERLLSKTAPHADQS